MVDPSAPPQEGASTSREVAGDAEADNGALVENAILDEEEGDNEDEEEGDGEEDLSAGFTVHVHKVPTSCTLDDVAKLFKHLGTAFCYRVSDSVVAVEFEMAGAAAEAVALTGTVLKPPKSGSIEFPGEAIDVVAQP
eukprot:gnl/TRDRNA2_/TRDRNA2_51050_c0_seq2.p1 gnl/TRDRNA2_/TRDRNA2_51050_c0~~gnl/TRDRNA2_/TRDRNA2_51050_c0_seq2.p1  ORF type:complete len:137 (-),score=35.56 gnl/TRDRNA2_/TRDRNA2_51050_c0_seq2:91-501(-)